MTKRNTRPAVAHMQKLKAEPRTNLPSLSKARLKELIEEAAVDAYGEEEQAGGFFTVIEEPLALPFRVKVLGVDADVEKSRHDARRPNCCHLPSRQKRGRRSQSWTCLCRRRHQQARNGLSLIATAAEGPGERIPGITISAQSTVR
jgi:hypothetical protein